MPSATQDTHKSALNDLQTLLKQGDRFGGKRSLFKAEPEIATVEHWGKRCHDALNLLGVQVPDILARFDRLKFVLEYYASDVGVDSEHPEDIVLCLNYAAIRKASLLLRDAIKRLEFLAGRDDATQPPSEVPDALHRDMHDLWLSRLAAAKAHFPRSKRGPGVDLVRIVAISIFLPEYDPWRSNLEKLCPTLDRLKVSVPRPRAPNENPKRPSTWAKCLARHPKTVVEAILAAKKRARHLKV